MPLQLPRYICFAVNQLFSLSHLFTSQVMQNCCQKMSFQVITSKELVLVVKNEQQITPALNCRNKQGRNNEDYKRWHLRDTQCCDTGTESLSAETPLEIILSILHPKQGQQPQGLSINHPTIPEWSVQLTLNISETAQPLQNPAPMVYIQIWD